MKAKTVKKKHRVLGKSNPMVLRLREEGYKERMARQAVNLVFDEIKAALARHEEVDIPIGKFTVSEHRVAPFRTWALGQPRALYRRRNFVAFEPSKEWNH